MGIPIERPARIFCDNEAVYKNASDDTSTLKKKYQSIAYHLLRQSVAASIVIIYKGDGNTNLANNYMKGSLSGVKQMFLRRCIMVNEKINYIPNVHSRIQLRRRSLTLT